MTALHSLIATQPDPPCVKYACPNKQQCAEQETACSSFRNYVQTGRVAHPQMRFSKRGGTPTMRDTITTTHAIYLSAMGA